MGSFGVVIVKECVYLVLDVCKVLFLVFGVAKTFFSEDAVKSFYKCLFVLFVWACCSY